MGAAGFSGSARARRASGAAFREQGADTPPTLPSSSTTNQPRWGGRAARRVTRNRADSSQEPRFRPRTIADLQPGSRPRAAPNAVPAAPRHPRASATWRYGCACMPLTWAPGRRDSARYLIRCVPSSAGWRSSRGLRVRGRPPSECSWSRDAWWNGSDSRAIESGWCLLIQSASAESSRCGTTVRARRSSSILMDRGTEGPSELRARLPDVAAAARRSGHGCVVAGACLLGSCSGRAWHRIGLGPCDLVHLGQAQWLGHELDGELERGPKWPPHT